MIVVDNGQAKQASDYCRRRIVWRRFWTTSREWWDAAYPKKTVTLTAVFGPFSVMERYFTHCVIYQNDEFNRMRDYDNWYMDRHPERNYTMKSVVQIVRRLR